MPYQEVIFEKVEHSPTGLQRYVNRVAQYQDGADTIFVIDESELFQEYMKGYLKNQLTQWSPEASRSRRQSSFTKCRVLQITNGGDAVSLAWIKPKLVFFEYYLTVITFAGQIEGCDWVFSQLKKASPESRLVMLTHATDPTILVKMVKLGLRDYVLKGLDHLQDINPYLEKLLSELS